MNMLKNIIREEINEMSSRAFVPIENDGYWIDMVKNTKMKYSVDNIEVVDFNTKAPKVRIMKSGFKPIIIWTVKPDHVKYLKEGRYYEYITNWLLNEVIPKAVNHFQPKEKNIKKLSPSASIEQKIEMWDLVGTKANTVAHKRQRPDELFYEMLHRKYGDYWNELYDQIKHTPEFEVYRQKHGIARSLNFDDELA